MASDICIIFLVNSSSNKSQTVIEHFDREWPFEETDIGFVIDDTSGRAAKSAQRLPHPCRTCTSSAIEQAIRDVSNLIDGCDYLISVGWSSKVPTGVLEIPDEAALNVHSSYLPNYRGLSVHRAQWANAETTGGVTVHRMTEKFDRGQIITQQRYRIGLFDTPLTMTRTIGELSASLLREAILLLEAGYEGQEQKETGDYYGLLTWRTVLVYGLVNHFLRAINIERRFEAPDHA